MNQIAKDILASIDASPEMIKLNKTKHRDSFDGDRSEILNHLYSHRELVPKLLASIYNSIFTQKRLVFIFSKRILQELVTNDPNRKRKTINGDEYKRLVLAMKGSGQFKVVQGCEMRGRSPMAMECCNDDIIRIVSAGFIQDLVLLQRQQAVDLYNELSQNTHQTTLEKEKEREIDNATQEGVGEFGSCPQGRLQDNSPNSLRREQNNYPDYSKSNQSESRLQIKEIYQAWLPSVSVQNINQRKLEMERLLMTIQSHGYIADDLTNDLKQKVLAVFVPSIRPKSCSKVKYETWLRLAERDYDTCCGEIFFDDLSVQENQSNGRYNDLEQQLQDHFYDTLGLLKEKLND